MYWLQARQPLAALKITIVQTCPDDLLYTFSLCLCTLVCTNKEREMRTGSQCLLVHCHCCCCCCSLGPFVIAHRIMCFLLFPLFFAVFSLFHCAQNAGFFALLFWVGVWGFGGWGFGWGGFRGRGGGGHNSVRVCVCAVVSPFPFFLITVVSVFFSLRQDVNFFVWRVWFCYCPCCLDRVRDLWFFGGWVLRDLGLCVLYMI